LAIDPEVLKACRSEALTVTASMAVDLALADEDVSAVLVGSVRAVDEASGAVVAVVDAVARVVLLVCKAAKRAASVEAARRRLFGRRSPGLYRWG
jgi:hypothetical protein